MTRYARSPGLRLESLDATWAVYCARSGDSLQLNTEAAAVLEVLESGPLAPEAICGALAADVGSSTAAIAEQLDPLWSELVTSGLIIEV